MKKYLLVLASVALLVFAFAAVAGAKYAGYAKDGSLASSTATSSVTPGYLSWGGAEHLMAQNGAPSELTDNPHGGYVTTTTKCAVCHSVHRANGIGVISGTAPASNANGVVNQFLTAGGASCAQCHCTWGATPVGLLVEWAGPATPQGGPHSSNGCSTCHGGGIHGEGASIYHGMNAFMLGNTNDAQITAEKAQLLARESVEDIPNSVISATHTNDGTSWFFDGTTYPVTVGDSPLTPLGSKMLASVYAAQRSILTGYTCSRSGCHTSSVLANLTWGQTYSRTNAQTGATGVSMTGHSSAPGINTGTEENYAWGGYDASCGPCHPGNQAGGYRGTGSAAGATNLSARAYGCDQCHDAVGAATNSTAFPHGNQGIEIYQWANISTPAGANNPTTLLAPKGNLWMYQASMATTSASGAFSGLVSPSVTLVQGAVGPDATGDVGNINDGVCLKCHIANDPASLAASGATNPLSISSPTSPHPTQNLDLSVLKGADINKLNFYTGWFDNYDPDSGSGGVNLIYLWY